MLTSTVCQPPMPADVIANALLGKGIGNILFPRTVGFPHCLTVADCNPCGASQIHIGVIKSGSSGRELTQEIMIIVTIVRTVSIAKNSPYRIERYRECYIVFANTISPLWLCYAKSTPVFSTAATRCSNIHT